MKHFFSLTILICGYFLAHSQVDQMEVTWGENMKARKMLVTDIMSTGNEQEIYAINSSLKMFNQKTFLEKYNRLKLTNQVELNTRYEPGTFLSQQIVSLDTLLYSLNGRRTKTEISLKAQAIDPDDFSISEEEKSIYRIKLIKGRRNSYGEYKSARSRNEQKVAYVLGHPGSLEEKEIMTVKVFDNQFELLWKTNITIPYERGLTRIESVNITNDGLVYILTTVFKDRKERVRQERNYENFVIVVDSNGIAANHKLELEKKFIRDLKLNVAIDGDLMCGGFYSNEGYRSDGVFFMTLDAKDFSIKTQSLKAFDFNFIVEGLSERAKARTKRKAERGREIGLAHVTFRDFVVKENGGAVLVGEYVNIYTTTTTDANGNTTSTTHYHYDDIYVISISPNGSIQWAKKIPKYQHTANDGGFYSSFFMVVNEDVIHFLYNVADRKETHLQVTTVDSDGKLLHENLISNSRRENLRIRPKSCEQTSKNTFVIFATSKRYYQFAQVKLN